MQFSLRLRRFKLGKVYKASGTRGRLFLDKSTSEKQKTSNEIHIKKKLQNLISVQYHCSYWYFFSALFLKSSNNEKYFSLLLYV